MMYSARQLSRRLFCLQSVILQSQPQCSYVTKNDSTYQQAQQQQQHQDVTSKSEKGSSELNKSSSPNHLQPGSSSRTKTVQQELEDNFAPYRYIYPEFLPDPNLKYRNRIREKLERMDMLARRSNIDIPEFYVGTIMKVGVADRFAVGKLNEFVGICIDRGGCGVRAHFTLRNVVDRQGVEIKYDMYNPIIQYITVLRLEKRLDEKLHFLRDCPLEHSTFPFDMIPELRNPDDPVPLNPIVLKLNPKPWCANWQTWDLKGVDNVMEHLEMDKIVMRKYNTFLHQTGRPHNVEKYDLMATYRSVIPMEEQTEIYGEVQPQLAKLSHAVRKQKRKRSFVKPQKTT